MSRSSRAARFLVVGVVSGLVLAGCSTVKGSGKPGSIETAGNVSAAQFPIKGDAGTGFDQLVRNALVDVNQFWTKAFPLVSNGKAFKPLTVTLNEGGS